MINNLSIYQSIYLSMIYESIPMYGWIYVSIIYQFIYLFMIYQPTHMNVCMYVGTYLSAIY